MPSAVYWRCNKDWVAYMNSITHRDPDAGWWCNGYSRGKVPGNPTWLHPHLQCQLGAKRWWQDGRWPGATNQAGFWARHQKGLMSHAEKNYILYFQYDWCLCGMTALCNVFMSHRAAKVLGPFLFGRQVTVVDRVITVHVMVTPAASTRSPSPAPQRMETSHGTLKSVAPS